MIDDYGNAIGENANAETSTEIVVRSWLDHNHPVTPTATRALLAIIAKQRERAVLAEESFRKIDIACAAECSAHAITLERLTLAEAKLASLATPCVWVQAGGAWDTSCGETVMSQRSATPRKMGYRVCPFCGHELVQGDGKPSPVQAFAELREKFGQYFDEELTENDKHARLLDAP